MAASHMQVPCLMLGYVSKKLFVLSLSFKVESLGA